MKKTIRRAVDLARSPRVLQLEGMFDVPPAERAALEWDVELPIEAQPWNIGLIVGPSGCGKSTIAREFFADAYVREFAWAADRSIIDGFPASMSIKDVTLLLSSVGFSSPPAWLRPFHVLSNGEQFRVTLARALAQAGELCVFDEFTSVVDRTVGKIGSAAVAKTVRKRDQKFIAVTCHDDVVDWLDPDWIYEPAAGAFQWRLVRRRPEIRLEIARVHHSAWRLFAGHHYLTADLAKAAICFCGFVAARPVGFCGFLPFVGKLDGRGMRVSRVVVLPDYQGVGVGHALMKALARMWRVLDYRVFLSTGHPAVVLKGARDPDWKLTRALGRTPRDPRGESMRRANDRLTASFEYVGAADMSTDTAQALLAA